MSDRTSSSAYPTTLFTVCVLALPRASKSSSAVDVALTLALSGSVPASTWAFTSVTTKSITPD